jgi:hypothetical protein
MVNVAPFRSDTEALTDFVVAGVDVRFVMVITGATVSTGSVTDAIFEYTRASYALTYKVLFHCESVDVLREKLYDVLLFGLVSTGERLDQVEPVPFH